MRIIYTDKELKIGDEVIVYAPSANKGEQVKFCKRSDTWGLRPIGMGFCAGNIPSLQTPSKHGRMADVNRFYKRFVVEDGKNT